MACIGCSSGPERTVANFCSTYFQEKQQFLSQYNVPASGNENFADAINNLATGFASLGDIPIIFDRLDKVAPDDIEPDVAAVRDAFKKQLDLADGAESNPLGALAEGLMSSLTTAGPFQRVSDYVSANCRGG